MATSSDQDTLTKIEAMAVAISHASGATKTALQREYLELIGHFLTDQGRGDHLSFPLLDLIEALEPAAEAQAAIPSERRSSDSEISNELLAKVSAVVDVLIAAGYSLDHACQIVTRQMIARSVQIPAGGDARAWRNIQSWRHKLLNSKREGAVWRTYAAFKDELPQIYGTRLGEAAAREAIWDRRVRRAVPVDA